LKRSYSVRLLCMLAVVVTGLFAVTASGASAAVYHSEASSSELHSEGTGSIGWSLGAKILCANSTWSGSMIGQTSNSVSLTPEMSGCTFAGTSVKFEPNGCVFKFEEPRGAGSPYTVKNINIVCPAGKSIVLRVGQGCTWSLPSQTMPSTTTATNETGERGRTVTFNLNASLSWTGSGGVCGTGVGKGSIGGAVVVNSLQEKGGVKVPAGFWVA
jgi:hypothetical protein